MRGKPPPIAPQSEIGNLGSHATGPQEPHYFYLRYVGVFCEQAAHFLQGHAVTMQGIYACNNNIIIATQPQSFLKQRDYLIAPVSHPGKRLHRIAALDQVTAMQLLFKDVRNLVVNGTKLYQRIYACPNNIIIDIQPQSFLKQRDYLIAPVSGERQHRTAALDPVTV
jgi:hypothetical protein